MSELHLYVAETDHRKGTKADIVVKDEITQEELARNVNETVINFV